MKKGTMIKLGIVLAVILVIISILITTNNTTINMEEQINQSSSSIKVQEKRRSDLIINLVDTVKSYAKYESITMQKITDARTKANNGKLHDAELEIDAVAEQYPQLKANEVYKQLMTELALTENMIAEHRTDYNIQIRSYNKFVRSFPANIILNILGYQNKNYTYLDYDVSENAPTNLFGDNG
jgi:LemA protein